MNVLVGACLPERPDAHARRANANNSFRSSPPLRLERTSTATNVTAVTRVVGVDVPMTEEEVKDYVDDTVDSESTPQLLPQPRTLLSRPTQINDFDNVDESPISGFSVIDHLRGGLEADNLGCEHHSGNGKFRVHEKFNCLICEDLANCSLGTEQ